MRMLTSVPSNNIGVFAILSLQVRIEGKSNAILGIKNKHKAPLKEGQGYEPDNATDETPPKLRHKILENRIVELWVRLDIVLVVC